MTNVFVPLGQTLFAQSRFGDDEESPKRPLTQNIPVTYTIATSQFASALPVSYQIQGANTAVMRVYYLITPPSAFSINGDSSIVRPDTIIYTPRPVTGRTLVGTPQLQGYQSVTWNYSTLLVAEFAHLISFYNPVSPTVLITYPNDEGTWVQRKAVMHPPTYGTQSTVIVSSVSFVFTRILS